MYPPAGMPSVTSIAYLVLTLCLVHFGLKKSAGYTPKDVLAVLRKQIVVLWILEGVKIVYRWSTGYFSDLDTWLPLYFCSITLFAGLLAAWGTGLAQRTGMVFMATGGIVGGLCFLLYPSSSMLLFPAFHYLSFHSFLYHGCMLYLGILLNQSGTIVLEKSDGRLYAYYTGFFCLLAIICNRLCGTNLMFITRPFKDTFLQTLYRLLSPTGYTVLLALVQMTGPFWVILLLRRHGTLLSPAPRHSVDR